MLTEIKKALLLKREKNNAERLSQRYGKKYS